METSRNGSKTDEVEDCEHSFILKDDMGYVCRVCGVIDKSILDIIDVNFSKVSLFLLIYAILCFDFLMLNCALFLLPLTTCFVVGEKKHENICF